MENLKVVVVGDGGVGKSCFLITWSTDSFPSEYVPTVFDNYCHCRLINGKPVNIALWDTAGQEDYDRLRPLSYPQTDVFIVCYDIARKSSFANIKDKWLPEVTHYCPDTPMVLLGLKSDLKDDQHEIVSREDGVQLTKERGLIGFHEVSSLNREGIDEAMNTVIMAGLSPLNQKKKKRFNLFRRKRSKLDSNSEPIIPPPPVMPQNEKAPWINIESSVMSTDWSKLINRQQFSDITVHLGSQQFYVHRYILCSSSDVIRQLLDIKTNVKTECLSQCVEWPVKRLHGLTFDRINEGLEEGFVSIITENQYSSGDLPVIHITLDSQRFTEQAFKRCMEFLYTGLISVDKNSEGLEDTMKAAALLNLPELQMICENARKDEEFLNPSIGTWLNDRNSVIAKDLFFNKSLLSDVQFLVEGQSVCAHKVVLATRCDVLGAMLTGGFAESNTNEIELPEVHHEEFLAMLEYLYTDHSPIEEVDSIGIMIIANQYVLPRLMSLCELYVTKQVDKACAKSIADADIDIIGLLCLSQLHNTNQLSGWCLHFISSNYLAFEHKEQFAQLASDNRDYIEQHRWPPISYLEAMEVYQRKYGSNEDVTEGRRNREKCSVM